MGRFIGMDTASVELFFNIFTSGIDICHTVGSTFVPLCPRKTLMELIFNPCGEFWWSLEGPVSQIHSPRLHDGAPGIFTDFLRSAQMLKREWVRKATGIYRTYSFVIKLQLWFVSSRWKTCLWAELQPWCLSLQWKTCPCAEHSDDDDDDGILLNNYE